MTIEIERYDKIANELKGEYPKMSDFEILSLAMQIQRNQILENGLGVSSQDLYPNSLGAIAIALGYTGESSQTITDVLKHKS